MHKQGAAYDNVQQGLHPSPTAVGFGRTAEALSAYKIGPGAAEGGVCLGDM